jgi:uncharacterized protein
MTETLHLGMLLILIPLVMVVAGAYASVGLGGGTGYLAIMTLVGMSASAITPTALLLNLVVTGAALTRFGLSGRLKWRLFLPFLLPAMPAAFLGGIVSADRGIFLALLAAALAVAAITMFQNKTSAQKQEAEPGYFRLLFVGIPAGLVIGFLSGFLGIGVVCFLGHSFYFSDGRGPKKWQQ